jgi:hypothetical protein
MKIVFPSFLVFYYLLSQQTILQNLSISGWVKPKTLVNLMIIVKVEVPQLQKRLHTS